MPLDSTERFEHVQPPVDETTKQREQETTEKIYYLGQLYDRLLPGISGGGAYAKFGEPNFSGDAATIFTLVNFDGKEKPELLKIGWGEFSANTFDRTTNHPKNHPLEEPFPPFSKIPHQVYCVNQNESYFVRPGTPTADQMEKQPADYLQQHSMFVAENGIVTVLRKTDESYQRVQEPIEPRAVGYNEAVRELRNLIIENNRWEVGADDFAQAFQGLPDDLQQAVEYLRQYDQDITQQELADAKKDLRDGAISEKQFEDYQHQYRSSRIGYVFHSIDPGHTRSEAANRLIRLKQAFNFETKQFER